MSDPSSMRVAHFSDLHLLALRGATLRAFFGKRMTGAVNLLLNRGGRFPVDVARALVADVRAQGPDHVVVTGDLSNLAFAGELRLAAEVLDGLGMAPGAVTVAPGNHDVYTAASHRSETFSVELARFLRGHVQPGPGHFPLMHLSDGLAVVALSSARPSPPLMAVGTVGSRQTRLAEALLMHPEALTRMRVVALHHPLTTAHVHWHNGLTDAPRLRAMLRRVGADLVLHGHIHRRSVEHIDGPRGPIPVVGVGSGTWLSPDDAARRAHYHVYELRPGAGLVAVETRRYDPDAGAFRSGGVTAA